MIGRKLGVAAEKLAGGKLVRIKVEFQDDKIMSVQVTGDFFIHPEEKIKEIEELFVLKSIFYDEKQLGDDMMKAIKKNGMTLIGITPEAIARITKKAIANPLPEKKKEREPEKGGAGERSEDGAQ